MRDFFDVEQYIKKLEQSESIQNCEGVPVPDITEKQNYIFISYSHKDYKKVYADLAYLYREGVRFWYDRGLPAGKNWDAEVKERLENPRCSGVIFYLSENMFLSKSVNEEISLVCGTEQQARKNYFCVNLSEGQPKDILKNIMRMDDEVLENAGLDMDRIMVLAKAFSDKQTYLQQARLGYRLDLLNQIKEQFDVIGETKKKRGVLVETLSGRVIEITADVFTMGKEGYAMNSCTFKDGYVSRRHATILTRESDYLIADEASANGTYLNNEKLIPKEEYPLKSGDKVRLGQLELTFYSGDDCEEVLKEQEKVAIPELKVLGSIL